MMAFVTPVLYPAIGAALYYLFSRAVITQPLWSRYPDWLYVWAVCPACSGTWYGGALAVLGAIQDWPFFGLAGTNPGTWLVAALWGCLFVPVFAALHLWAMERVMGQEAERSWSSR